MVYAYAMLIGFVLPNGAFEEYRFYTETLEQCEQLVAIETLRADKVYQANEIDAGCYSLKGVL